MSDLDDTLAPSSQHFTRLPQHTYALNTTQSVLSQTKQPGSADGAWAVWMISSRGSGLWVAAEVGGCVFSRRDPSLAWAPDSVAWRSGTYAHPCVAFFRVGAILPMRVFEEGSFASIGAEAQGHGIQLAHTCPLRVRTRFCLFVYKLRYVQAVEWRGIEIHANTLPLFADTSVCLQAFFHCWRRLKCPAVRLVLNVLTPAAVMHKTTAFATCNYHHAYSRGH